MHSSTKKWKAPRIKAKEEGQRKLKARKHLCPDSPFFTEHFNFQQHETKMLKEKEMFAERTEPAVVPIKPFGGKTFAPSLLEIFDDDYHYNTRGPWEGKFLQTTCSSVLCLPTIWQQDPDQNKYFVFPMDDRATAEVALFPSIQEYKFEGPDRIATTGDLRRFLPVPRNPCDQTVNWSIKPFLKPHNLDAILENNYPTEEDILTYDWEIGLPNDEDLQISLPKPTDRDDVEEHDEDPYNGEKATRLLGNDLLAALDPQNVYF